MQLTYPLSVVDVNHDMYEGFQLLPHVDSETRLSSRRERRQRRLGLGKSI